MNQTQRPTTWYRWLKWGDYLMYLVITLAAFALFLQGPALLKPVSGAQGLVSIDGQTTQVIPADQLQGSGSFKLDAHGYHYTIEYSEGKIRVSEADCPDKVCVKTGWVSRPGEVTACVPGHLILSVSAPSGSASGDDLDMVLK